MARYATGDPDEALDLVQDAMTRLVSRYQTKPPQQWRPLFFRILERRITDWHRRQQLNRRLFFWRDADQPGDSNDDSNESYLEQLAAQAVGAELSLHRQRQLDSLPGLIRQLPLRQQQCFLLRCWEGLDVAQTAAIMGCSQGSVKTHYARALRVLRQALEEGHG